jgi:hypothetical protein
MLALPQQWRMPPTAAKRGYSMRLACLPCLGRVARASQLRVPARASSAPATALDTETATYLTSRHRARARPASLGIFAPRSSAPRTARGTGAATRLTGLATATLATGEMPARTSCAPTTALTPTESATSGRESALARRDTLGWTAPTSPRSCTMSHGAWCLPSPWWGCAPSSST